MSPSKAQHTAVRRRRRLVNTLTIAPLAVLAVGSAISPMSQVSVAEAAPTVQAPQLLPAPAGDDPAPTTQPPVAVMTDGPDIASPARGIAASRVLARSASYTTIPSDALAAYQRAAAVIDESAPGCHLSWTLLGAIGQVESNHGQVSAVPGTVVGVRLNGKHGTLAVPDTDGGSLDGDPTWDRAVGPLQFLPSTWRAVGVDADGDGTRDPQDIDDASLAAAVYLCGSGQDLATPEGRHAAVLSYNHSERYAASVLGVDASYAAGEQTVVTAYPISVDTQVVDPLVTTAVDLTPKPPKHRKPKHLAAAPAPAATAATPAAATPAPATPAPTAPAPEPTPTVDPATAAAQTCTDQGLVDDPTVTNDAFDICVAKELGQPLPTPDPAPAPTPPADPAPDSPPAPDPSPAPSTPAG